jgi:hypothetical protein
MEATPDHHLTLRFANGGHQPTLLRKTLSHLVCTKQKPAQMGIKEQVRGALPNLVL